MKTTFKPGQLLRVIAPFAVLISSKHFWLEVGDVLLLLSIEEEDRHMSGFKATLLTKTGTIVATNWWSNVFCACEPVEAP